MLGWELERAGISFALIDRGLAHAASIAGAGIINPITGRRLVKSWRYESLHPVARETYRALEAELGVPLWREMRVRRLFADEQERRRAQVKQTDPDLAPFLASADGEGWWIRDAARVDVAALLAVIRARWMAMGKLRTDPAEIERAIGRGECVVDCRGLAGAEAREFAFVPWEFSQGEVLELKVAGLEPDVILNRRFWVAPIAAGVALAGATHEPGMRDGRPTASGGDTIAAAVSELLGPERPFGILGHRGGVRVTLGDKRPVAGRHPANPRMGIINALGAKGALWAPMLARQWAAHLARGTAFDPEIDVGRFWPAGGAVAP